MLLAVTAATSGPRCSGDDAELVVVLIVIVLPSFLMMLQR
jgi:hypothetical protein